MTNAQCKIDGCEKMAKAKSGGVCSMHAARWSRHGTYEFVGHKKRPVEELILVRVAKADGCWSWSGWIDTHGYAKLRRREGGNIAVHRWMYERFNGPLIPGLQIDHACGNRGCVNPAHLRQVTPKQNVEHFTTALRSHNTSGYRGVHFHKASGLWVAKVKSDGVTKATYHHSKEEAAVAAHALRIELHTHNDLDRVS